MLGFGLGLNKWRRVGGGYVGLLDLFPNAAAAYSLRKLRAAYSGAAVRVRESGGNTEADIGFDANGDLDTTALLAHCGANDGHVVTWYDQSGNVKDATQATASEQPLVVSAGSLVTENGKAAIDFDGISNNLGVSLRLTHYPIAAMAVQKWNSTAGGQMSFLLSEVSGGQIYFPWNQSSGTFSYRYGDGVNNIAYNKTATTNQILSSLSVGASGGSFKENNVQVGSAISVPSAARLSAADITLGAYTSSSLFADVFIQELIIFASDQSSNRTGIESNINNFYSIYP